MEVREPGYKKKIREELLPEVIRLHESGKSNQAIARLLAAWVPLTTIRRWLKRARYDAAALP